MPRQNPTARPALIAALHARVNSLGISDENYRAILNSYGAQHSTDLDANTIREILEHLKRFTTPLDPRKVETDKWRRRVMGVAAALMRRTGYPDTTAYIKALACQMASVDSFNQIPLDRLRSIYNALHHRLNDIETVTTLVAAPSPSPSGKPNPAKLS